MLVSEGLVLALRDGYPVSRGHSLIVPRRHVGSFGEVRLDEQSAMLAMLRRVKALLDEELRPDGYNIGINDGAAAGQTVMHVHMHVIPRYRGDRPDPRGGIRTFSGFLTKAILGGGRLRGRLAQGLEDLPAALPGQSAFPEGPAVYRIVRYRHRRR